MHAARRQASQARRRAIALLGAASLVAGSARAVDPFEIQVYDGTANPPGSPGVELHVNHVFNGGQATVPPELPRDKVTHMTLEPSLGVLPWWEPGAYLQTALRRDGTFDFAGVKARSKFVTPKGWDERWRLGLNVEVSILPERYERDRWATELRPIVAWESPRLLLALNPILDQSLAGEGATDGPSFEPAALAIVKLRNVLGVGVEYYGNFGPIGSGFVRGSAEEHYLYEVVNLLGIDRVELNLGVGEGLTAASDKLVAKAILGYVWDAR